VLLQCKNCFLRYRFPIDSKEYSFQFYQNNYIQKGLTTELPSQSQLDDLVKINFLGSEKDFSACFDVLDKLSSYMGKKLALLDYGANWGYACYQFQRLDFIDKVFGYELSIPRRQYGQKNLDIRYVDDPSHLAGSIDVLFSSHVIEHMSNPSEMKDIADTVLRPGGIVMILCPNGSDSARVTNKNWSKFWGQVHPNFISDLYLCKLFWDYDGIVVDERVLHEQNQIDFDFPKGLASKLPDGDSLLLLAKKPLKTDS
jgi:hypothetical protein